jgi:hypothetical protein
VRVGPWWEGAGQDGGEVVAGVYSQNECVGVSEIICNRSRRIGLSCSRGYIVTPMTVRYPPRSLVALIVEKGSNSIFTYVHPH